MKFWRCERRRLRVEAGEPSELADPAFQSRLERIIRRERQGGARLSGDRRWGSGGVADHVAERADVADRGCPADIRLVEHPLKGPISVAGDRNVAGQSFEIGARRVRLAVAADEEVGAAFHEWNEVGVKIDRPVRTNAVGEPAPLDFGVQTPFERAGAENVEGGGDPFGSEPRHQTGQMVDAFDRVEPAGEGEAERATCVETGLRGAEAVLAADGEIGFGPASRVVRYLK